MSAQSESHLLYLHDVLGINELIQPIGAHRASASKAEQPKLLLVSPDRLSTAGQELLDKMADALQIVNVEVVGVNNLQEASHQQNWALVFGQKSFVELGGNEVEFFDHLNKALLLKNMNCYCSHDIEDMLGDGPQVKSLKKQVWLQLKSIVKKMREAQQ